MKKRENELIRVLNVMGSLDRGGQETTIMHHYRHMDRDRVQFDFLLTDQPSAAKNFEDEAIAMGARIFRRPLRSKKPFQNAKALHQLLKTHPEINRIHIHNFSPMIAIDTWIAKRCNVPMRIAHSRCEYRSMPLYQKAFRPLLRATSTHWLACSQPAGISLFGKHALNDERFQILPNARALQPFLFDSELRQAKRKEMGIDKSIFVWLHIGRLVEQKNQGFLLNVFASSLKNNPNQILLIAGTGEKLEQLKKRADQLHISDKVYFLSLREDIPELLQAADLFVLPSLYEGLPGTVIEAQASGVHCLLSNTIAPEAKITELVHFLPIDHESAWVDAVDQIDHHVTAVRNDMTDAMKQAGYDIESAAKQLMNLYSMK